MEIYVWILLMTELMSSLCNQRNTLSRSACEGDELGTSSECSSKLYAFKIHYRVYRISSNNGRPSVYRPPLTKIFKIIASLE